MEPGHDTQVENGAAVEEPSVGELARQLSDQTSHLARAEVELAKAELSEKGKRIGAGAGAFGAAGIVGLFAFAALTAGAILGLAEAVDAWLASLIVAAAYGAVAAVIALAGKRQVDEGTPPAPERAIASSKADVDRVKRGIREGRS